MVKNGSIDNGLSETANVHKLWWACPEAESIGGSVLCMAACASHSHH